MKRPTLSYGVALLGASVVHALAFWSPVQTGVAIIPSDAQNPRPTTPPGLHELLRRQSKSTDTFLVAPDNTCGFVSGLAGAGFACNARTATCVFVTSAGGHPGGIGCCDQRDCGFRLFCLDFVQINSSSACNNGCQLDTFTLKCSESTAQFCNTVSFSGGVLDYFCGSLNVSTPQEAFTTFNGETDGRKFSTLVASDTTSGSLAIPPTTRSTTSSAGATSTSAAPNNDSGGSSTPVGAIVGGVVGGVAVLGLIVLGVLFLLRKRKSQTPPPAGHPAEQAPPGQPNMQQHPPQQAMAPGGHDSYYGTPAPMDPAKMNHPQQPYGTPPPQGVGQPQQGYYPDRGQAASPVSMMTAHDPHRMSTMSAVTPTSQANPMSAQPHQQPNVPPTVHEAGGNTVGGGQSMNDNHRGTMAELA